LRAFKWLAPFGGSAWMIRRPQEASIEVKEGAGLGEYQYRILRVIFWDSKF
jgi:hypothetical protein